MSSFGKSREMRPSLLPPGRWWNWPRKSTMAESPHYKELLQLLNEFEVEYLIVGGFAVMKYGEPRYTKDLDLWVNNSAQNSQRVVGALRKFGAPLDHDEITAETFAEQHVVYQI